MPLTWLPAVAVVGQEAVERHPVERRGRVLSGNGWFGQGAIEPG